MSDLWHIAALQPALQLYEPRRNLELIDAQIAALRRAGPLDLVVLPEAADGRPPAGSPNAATDSHAALAALARSHGVVLVAGSLAWDTPGIGRQNVAFVFDRRGNELGGYAKRRPFSQEQGRIVPGKADGLIVVDDLRIGLLICGDLWHPELAREYLKRADLLCVPARSGVPAESHVAYARALWWSMALTRATENALPVIVADWPAAAHPLPKRPHWTAGGASVVNPAARPDLLRLQRTLTEGAAGAVRGEISLAGMAEFRRYRASVGLLPRDGG